MTTDTITAAASGTWQLGDRTVNRLGYGAMRIMTKADGSPSDRDTVIAVLRRAVELGVNHIDTAAFYFSALRSSNELINTALAPYPDDLVITTKVGPGRDPSGDWLTDGPRPEQLRGQVEENIRQLGRDHLDVVNLRIGSGLDRGEGTLADRFGALAELREAGLIRHLGISNVGAGAPHRGPVDRPGRVRAEQVLADHRSRGRLPDRPVRRARRGLRAVLRHRERRERERPAGRPRADRPGAGRGGGRRAGRGASTASARRRSGWPGRCTRDPNVLAIPGTGSLDHLAENVAAGALRLTDDDLARLDTIG